MYFLGGKMNDLEIRIMEKMIELYAGDVKRIQHFTKVYTYASYIGECEGLDENTLGILKIAALMHDIGIHECEKKYGNCQGKLQEKEGPAIAETLLSSIKVSKAIIDRVMYLIAHHHTYTDVNGIDWQILLEADFLVNGYEDELSTEAIRTGYNNIFKTETGKKICREMYGMEKIK